MKIKETPATMIMAPTVLLLISFSWNRMNLVVESRGCVKEIGAACVFTREK
jgi:hypothetical protein